MLRRYPRTQASPETGPTAWRIRIDSVNYIRSRSSSMFPCGTPVVREANALLAGPLALSGMQPARDTAQSWQQPDAIVANCTGHAGAMHPRSCRPPRRILHCHPALPIVPTRKLRGGPEAVSVPPLTLPSPTRGEGKKDRCTEVYLHHTYGGGGEPNSTRQRRGRLLPSLSGRGEHLLTNSTPLRVTPSPLVGEGWGEGESRRAVWPSANRLEPKML